MQLPLLSEEQEKMVRRYGCEHCDEMLIVERGGGAVVAGVLRQPFKTKKVAQTSFGINLKSWKITPPKYVRGWYRELSSEEYTAEFDGVPRVLGRRMQATQRELYALEMLAELTRDQEVRAKAQLAKEKKEKGERLLVKVDHKLMQEMFDVFAPESRHRHRERLAFRRAELDSKKAVAIWAMEDKRKAEADYAERLKCPKFREEVDLERIAKEKENQAANVAYHAEEKEKKRRRIERLREWPV